MHTYLLIKTLHILSAGILFGSGIAIAVFMLFSRNSDNLVNKYFAARYTVLADTVLTLPAVIIQPITGIYLIHLTAYEWTSRWLVYSYVLYLFIGLCWLPVVWIQIQLKKIVANSLEHSKPLPERYHRLFRIWFILGWPAFTSLIAIVYLMVAKPL